jgi:hypothetical protein
MNPAQRKARKERAEDFRYLQVLRDKYALIDGWKCPVCKQGWTDCPHKWDDVEKANNEFLLKKLKDGRMEVHDK